MKLSPGTFVGDFLILKSLGEGGAGTVYAAQHTWTRQKRALKLIPRGTPGDVACEERAMGEIAALRAVRDSRVVRLYDNFQWQTYQVLVLELIEGETLAALLRNRPQLGMVEALMIVRAIASSLLPVHSKCIIHRDLKPENFIFRGNGELVILDFSIALAPFLLRKTLSTDLIGSHLYMSPEQVLQAPIGPRADLYALGTLAYQMLSGSHPFNCSDPRAILAQVATQRPKSLNDVNPAIPDDVNRLVMRLLEKEPNDRPQSAEAVISSIDQILSNTDKITVEPPRPIWSRVAMPEVVLVLLVGVVSYFGGLLISGQHSSPHLAALPVERPPATSAPGDRQATPASPTVPPNDSRVAASAPRQRRRARATPGRRRPQVRKRNVKRSRRR